jgi:mannose-1-phosphate guanylyltransferase
MKKADHSPVRCGIILAAGQGQRLQPFIERLRGDRLPKQYVSFIGPYSMLQHTFRRAEKLIHPQRIFTVVGQDHLKYREVWQQLSSRPRGTTIVQPENKNTGPGLFLPLRYLCNHYPDSVVAIFPSDHFIAEEDLFMEHVKRAFHIVERNPDLLVLLGIKPNEPEPEYGYILPGEPVTNLVSDELRRVYGFVEKPEPHIVRGLIQNGGLWNTFVMVFRTHAMLDLLRRAVPSLYDSFEQIGKAVGKPQESDVVEAVYRDMQSMDFSREILECLAKESRSRLAVLQVKDVFWSDWGSEPRILTDLKKLGYWSRFHEVYQNGHLA